MELSRPALWNIPVSPAVLRAKPPRRSVLKYKPRNVFWSRSRAYRLATELATDSCKTANLTHMLGDRSVVKQGQHPSPTPTAAKVHKCYVIYGRPLR